MVSTENRAADNAASAIERGEVVYESRKSSIDKSKLRASVGV